MIDRDGRKPGDWFPTMDQAARDFAYFQNAESIAKNIEYAVAFRRKKMWVHTPRYFFTAYGPELYYEISYTVQYSYTVSVIGSSTIVSVPSVPPGEQLAGIGHTHGAYKAQSPDGEKIYNDNFSPQDIEIVSSYLQPIFLYVSTPSGTLRRYNPITQLNQEIFPTDNFPYDPKHPAVRK